MKLPRWAPALLLAALVVAAYWGHWRGQFVYDDVPQIVGNPLLRTTEETWRALGKDVWAFKGERQEAWSNYWRPGFVLWLAVNYRLFGVESTVGWHWGLVSLHFLACYLALLLLRRAGAPRGVAIAAAAVFAVHPSHLESVAWISGAPDVLATNLLLGALLALPRAVTDSTPWRWAASLLLFALALLTKELAIATPVLVLALDATMKPTPTLRNSLRRAAPFAVVAGIFLLTRHVVLGFNQVDVPWRLSPAELAFTLPRLFWFYGRQAFLPLEVGPSYPIRAVTESSWGAGFQLVVLCLILAALVRWARHRPVACFTLSIALLPLLPAMNVNAYIPEQIVHDRYLYLPLLGFWATAFLVGDRLLLRGQVSRKWWAVIPASVAVLLLLVQSQRHIGSWSSERQLWDRGVSLDPGSAFAWAHLGLAEAAAGNTSAAAVAFDRSLELAETPPALMGRAQLRASQGDWQSAERDLSKIVRAQPDNSAAIERLASLYQQAGQLDRALALLLDARDRIPHRRCVFTAGAGVVYYLSGERELALSELEHARSLATRESLPPCQLGLFQLAMLHLELQNPTEALAALNTYLELTEDSPHSVIALRRSQAETLRVRIGRELQGQDTDSDTP